MKNDYKQQKSLPNILYELKKCDSYSRSSKFYDKNIKSKKIREIMKTMGFIKCKHFSELELFYKTKKKEMIPFNSRKVKEYLLREEEKIKERNLIKQEILNNKPIKKLYRMTVLNIEDYKSKHPNKSPSIGTYNPNYDSIYKKSKATLIFAAKESNKNGVRYNLSSKDIIKNKTLLPINKAQTFINEYKNKDKGNNSSSIKRFSYNDNKNKDKKDNSNKFGNINFNTISNTSSRIKLASIKRNISSENKNESMNSNSNKNTLKNINKNIDIFNKTRTYEPFYENKSKSRNPKLLQLLSRNDKERKKIMSHKTIFIKPTIPSIGYYHPNYDFIKENIPKISFYNHNDEKDPFAYKKNLLRKIVSKYDVNEEYQVIKSLNSK